MSDKAQTIHKAFVAAQSSMEPARKSSENKGFKSTYADLAAVQDACFPALHTNGFAVRYVNGVTDDGQHYVETILAHESGEFFNTRVPLFIGKADMQGLGSAITYARRYGLLSLMGIAPEDDDGQAAVKTPATTTNARQESEAKHEAAVQTLIGLIESADTLQSLREIWTDAAGTAAVKDRRAAAAKDARKAQLEAAPQPFIDDEIPY